ncbi:unnamed protein product [Dicrocoelium dendriticum]|nr:unnamed protein product [Dicrocoelium dendriticum]
MKFGPSICVDQDCHPYAHCVDNRCACRPGYEGDGYLKCKRQTGGSRLCGQCRGIPLKELAQCIDGKCTCVPGYVEAHPGVCMECVQSNCHPEALCLQTPMYNNTFSCQCKSGYVGDGVNACQPLRASEPEQPSIDSTCGGGCSIRNSDCNRRTGRCECRPGYDWDGRSQCVWNCRLCIADAICDHQNERCACKPGYYGDGQTYCELLPTRPGESPV